MFTYHAGTGRYAHLYVIATHFPHEAEWAPPTKMPKSVFFSIEYLQL
jgi:hypothetical protein